ncbi:hypothetical protein WUBG_18564 [Wuchereria bancrofti]|uniref:ATP-dependent RNA helicase n=1 Tax=Wuchereria bancrofti TaxID=6293 RepID=J9E5C7_WUCBA|nr:hypothetical protein WUBG_18564 [Wuchereria bancrofti]
MKSKILVRLALRDPLYISAHENAPQATVVCTPGRLLQHMDENSTFSCEQLQILVIDEADRILDLGFSRQQRKPKM